jgi:DNA-nicking Smr family endonuclease
MSRKRVVSEEERALFVETLSGARKSQPAPKAQKKPAQSESIAKQKPQAPRVNGATDRRLRKGEMEPEARLDLHGLTEASAHHAVLTFVRTAHARGLKLVLIVTGKGKPVARDQPFDMELAHRARGVLKSMTPRWLQEPELAKLIADIRSSHRRHGGDGALYVYLRKGAR